MKSATKFLHTLFEQILPFFIIFSSSISQNIEKTKLKSIFVQM